MWCLVPAAIVLAFASTRAVDGASPPVRVVGATDTRLELAVRLLASPPGPNPAGIRDVVLERDAPDRPWRVVRGLVDGEIAGPDRLTIVSPDGGTSPFRPMSAEIGSSVGDGVTLVDLPEGDAAFCIWSDGTVREAWFLDGFFPECHRTLRRTGNSPPEAHLWMINAKASRIPHIRACIALCLSPFPGYALAAGQCLASGSPEPGTASSASPGPALRHSLEASEAAFAFGQAGIDPPPGAATDLYRWIMAEARAAFDAGPTAVQRTSRSTDDAADHAAREGAANRDAIDSKLDASPGDKGTP